MENELLVKDLSYHLTRIISETNGITLSDTIEIANTSHEVHQNKRIRKYFGEFQQLLSGFQSDYVHIDTVLSHPVARGLRRVLHFFSLRFREDHIHLTGSLTADFIYPRLTELLNGPHKEAITQQIAAIFGPECLPIESVEDIDHLIRLKDDDHYSSSEDEQELAGFHFQSNPRFDRYLQVLLLPKLLLTSRRSHVEAAYHMAKDQYEKYNIGQIRLKFTLSRASTLDSERVPGAQPLSPEDVILGLYEGFNSFKSEHSDFNFILSPCFRKETDFFDQSRFASKSADFNHQIESLLQIRAKHPFLRDHLCDIDTVGNERGLYRKEHFIALQNGFNTLHNHGFYLRSHHGETWNTLRLGVQAVDNALNIWHIDTLEHGLSVGINPNFYFHGLYQRIMACNRQRIPLQKNWVETRELLDMKWGIHDNVVEKLLAGKPLSVRQVNILTRIKLHTALEVEHYQHDVLNRLISKGVTLTALPSSNQKLTGRIPDYKDHPFSWWEKKGVKQAVGTDNYVTLNTDFLREMLILLISDPKNLKITKLLMVCTGETRRPYLSQLLWEMRSKIASKTIQRPNTN